MVKSSFKNGNCFWYGCNKFSTTFWIYIDDKITSPEKTQEEVDYLRYGLPELTGLEKELQEEKEAADAFLASQ